jgi:hypothetical protein
MDIDCYFPDGLRLAATATAVAAGAAEQAGFARPAEAHES